MHLTPPSPGLPFSGFRNDSKGVLLKIADKINQRHPRWHLEVISAREGTSLVRVVSIARIIPSFLDRLIWNSLLGYLFGYKKIYTIDSFFATNQTRAILITYYGYEPSLLAEEDEFGALCNRHGITKILSRNFAYYYDHKDVEEEIRWHVERPLKETDRT